MSFSSPRTSPPSSPLSKAAIRSRSPPLVPMPSLSTTLPGLTAFDRAVHVVNISNMTSQIYKDSQAGSSEVVDFTPEDQLLLYGAYKQATKGDVKGLKPTFFDISARSKWQAWANMRGKSKDEAREVYVDLVVKSLTKPGSHPDHIMLADEILQRPSTPPPPASIQNILGKVADTTTPSSLNPSEQFPQLIRRRSSNSQSIRSGVRSTVASVYELASESPFDGEIESTAASVDPAYSEFTETVIEEEILDEDEFAAEVQRVTLSRSQSFSQNDVVIRRSIDAASHGVANNVGEEEEEDEEEDEVYQSSEEYDEADSDEKSIEQRSARELILQAKHENLAKNSVLVNKVQDPTTTRTEKRHGKVDDFVDEGVFEEEEKDEHVTLVQDSLGAPEPVEDIIAGGEEVEDEEEKAFIKAPISRNGSISSGYGGSVFSDKESTLPYGNRLSYGNTLEMLVNGNYNDNKKTSLPSPSVEPYRVNVVYDTVVTPLELNNHESGRIQVRNSQVSSPRSVGRLDTHAASTQVAAPASSASTAPSSPSSSTSSPSTSSTVATVAAIDEPVCPVSKKTASSGGVCPAAMFAQARANASAAAAAEGSSDSHTPSVPVKNDEQSHSTPVHSNNTAVSPSSPPSTLHHRSATLPVSSSTSNEAPAPSSSSSTSSVVSATNRLGQNIVSRFTALRSSLAAASARAASSALSGGSTSIDPNSVVVKDQVTQQSVTIVCPHLKSTQALETEVIRLQTDITVLHERLDLLQQSLKLKSESRKLEQRSLRGIVKLVLRQGLINAILLLIVFAILYKRRSPIAYAVLAYIGHSRKEGEAGWRALMRWTAGLVRTGQKNQQIVLAAGRRNGYW